VANGIRAPASRHGLPHKKGTTIPKGNKGRPAQPKAVHVLLEASAILQRQGIDFTVLIAGEGPERSALEDYAVQLGIENVSFIGRLSRPQVERFYGEVDIIVVPSVWPDPLPVVVQEAMARAKVLVGSNIGGIPAMLADGAGVTVTSACPRELADALSAFSDPQLRLAYSSRARRRFEQCYGIKAHAAALESQYLRIINARGSKYSGGVKESTLHYA